MADADLVPFKDKLAQQPEDEQLRKESIERELEERRGEESWKQAMREEYEENEKKKKREKRKQGHRKEEEEEEPEDEERAREKRIQMVCYLFSCAPLLLSVLPSLITHIHVYILSLPPSLLPSLSFFLSLLLCHIHASYWSLSRLYVDRLSSYCPMPRKPPFILSHPCPSYSIVLLFRRIRDCRLWLDKSGRKEMPKH